MRSIVVFHHEPCLGRPWLPQRRLTRFSTITGTLSSSREEVTSSGNGLSTFRSTAVPIFAVNFDGQIAYLTNEWNKGPVLQLAMVDILPNYPFITTSLGEDRESLLQNSLDLVERHFLRYLCSRTNDTSLSNRQQQSS